MVNTVLTAGGVDRRHPAYLAAAAVAGLAHPDLDGLYDLDAEQIAAALPTILRSAFIPGQLGELFEIAAAIAAHAEWTEDIPGALQAVAAAQRC